MIKGLYASFTAMEAAWQYQDALANNIANATTPGFKREIASKESFRDILLSRSAPIPAPLGARVQDIIGQIGSGGFIAQFSTDYGQGALQPTGNELDVALSDGFFGVEGPDGSVFYTRDGHFGRDANGDLVTSHGYFVLNSDGGHINLPLGSSVIGPDGDIVVGGQRAGRLQMLDFAPGDLVRAGEAYFTSSVGGTPVTGSVRQGMMEMSNTNMVEELTTLLSVQRTFQANQTVLARLDSTLDLAAGQVGVVRP